MMKNSSLRMFFLGLSVSGIILISFFGGAVVDRVLGVTPLDTVLNWLGISLPTKQQSSVTSVPELPVPMGSVADVAERASTSVVTVSIKTERPTINQDLFSMFGIIRPEKVEQVQEDIGTGFVADSQGLIITNKHVVADGEAEYLVIDNKDREYAVTNIYRDPTNDIAILKVEGLAVEPLPLGDSSKIKVGQEVIAIGTALGEFRHTVTTGVISGLGRGIEAGDPFGGFVESLENVIQTDAAINPGNSGGPLLDSTGSVIGVNVAVTAGAQNIGFAIPINTIKSSLDTFNKTGQFNRPFLGVRYQVISERAAVLNEVPQGAYLLEVVVDSPAAQAGLKAGDIITHFGDKNLKETDLVSLINERKVGESVVITFWRDGQEQEVRVVLQGSDQ
jgi:serine protease Do